MNIISKLSLTVFEIMNELHIAMGAGVAGIAILLNHGYRTNQLLRTLTVVSVTIGSLMYIFQAPEKKKPSRNQIVLITGCDSGLGFSLAQHVSKTGYTVLAGFLSLGSAGAQEIKNLQDSNIKQLEIDITKSESVTAALLTATHFLESNPKFELLAVINNAAVMIFGEFEWFTEKLVQQEIDVNLVGSIRVSRAFIPLLRKYKGRLINIVSHCAFECLPGLSVYGATKAGVKAFSDGIRVELDKYGVNVITVVPGSFITQCGLMARHPEHIQEMRRNFTQEQQQFYGDYFQRYNAHLLSLPVPKTPQKLDNKEVYGAFDDALMSVAPRAMYRVSPLRYSIFHFMFKYSPVAIRDYLVLKFMQMPEYQINQNL